MPIQENKKEQTSIIRGYHRFSKAWYATDEDRIKQTIQFGMYNPADGTSGEMTMQWEMLNNKLVPQLRAFDDSWKVLATFTDLIKKLAKWDDKNITEEQFAGLLSETGFKDLTSYKKEVKQHRPRVVAPPTNRRMKP